MCLACSDLEAQLEADRLRDEEREKQRQEEREHRRQQQIEEKARRERADIEQMKVGEDERERLLREHDENIAKYDLSLKDEQARSQAALKAKLEARRNKKRAVEMARLEKDMVLEGEEAQKRELLDEMKEESRSKGQGADGDEEQGVSGTID